MTYSRIESSRSDVNDRSAKPRTIGSSLRLQGVGVGVEETRCQPGTWRRAVAADTAAGAAYQSFWSVLMASSVSSGLVAA